MLGELEQEGGAVICDLEAGVGSLLRMSDGHVDLTLVIVEPTVKSIEAATRAAAISAKHSKVIVVANRVRDDSDTELIRAAFVDHEIHVVPFDPQIRRADRDGTAPIEFGNESPGLAAISALAEKVAGSKAPA